MKAFRHVCSIDSLLCIISEERFRPHYPSPLAGDSGINGYIEGDAFNSTQEIAGRGAELIIDWQGEILDDLNAKMEFPLPPNVLVRQGAWRSIIPCNTDKALIKAVDFEIHGKPTLRQKMDINKLKKRLEKEAIYLTLLT